MPDKKHSHEDSIFDKVIGDAWKDRFLNVVGEFKLPNEALNYILSQVDETKHAAVGIITKEVRKYLENTDLSEELLKVMTGISLEITTNIRFARNSDKKNRIKLKVTSEKSSDEQDGKDES